MKSPTILLAVATASLPRNIVAQTVEFFYTETLDTCEMKGVSIAANEQTTHGGVCAWRPDVERVYGCPAPDTTCWTLGQTCTDSGIGQTVCNKAGSVWCCNAVAGETCTTAEGYINVCQSGFANPESGVSVDHANQVYLAAIGLSNVTATSQTVDPTPFSTTNLGTASTATSTSSPSGGSSTVTKSGSSTDTSSPTTASASQSSSSSASNGSSESSTNSTDPTASKSRVSTGAIVGIVIGLLLVLAAVGTAFFILGRRRTKAQSTYDPIGGHAAPAPTTVYGDKDARIASSELHGYQDGTSELGDSTVTRAEMPANYATYTDAKTEPRHELA